MARHRTAGADSGAGRSHLIDASAGLEASENSRAILKQEYAAAKQDDLELAPRLLDQRGRHLTHRPSDGDPHHVNESPASFSRDGGAFVAGYVHAPRANRTTSNVFREEDALQKIDPAGHDRLAAAANKSPGDNAVSLFSYSPQQARPSEINALSYRDLQSQ